MQKLQILTLLTTRFNLYIFQVVAPKKRGLESAEAVLATQMAKLQEKRAELKAVTDELNELEENLLSNQNEKEVRGKSTQQLK